MENNIKFENPEQDFDLMALIGRYLANWKWFVLGVVIASFCAFTYLRYAVPQYRSAATILIKDENKGGVLSELSAFKDIGGTKSNLDNEIEILKSRTLAESAVKKLNLNIVLIEEGKIRDAEIYENKPIQISIDSQTPGFYAHSFALKFKGKSSGSFELKAKSVGETDLLQGKTVFHYGEIIETKYGNFVITKDNSDKIPLKDAKLDVVFGSLADVAESYRSRLVIAPMGKNSNVIELSIIDPVMEKAEDYLNTLVQTYNENAVVDKNIISENTSRFIANRLELITEELGGVEQNVESFKRTNKLIDIESEAELFKQEAGEYNKRIVEIEIQLNVLASMFDFLNKSSNSDLLPANLVSQGDASGLISSYNGLVLERNKVLKSASESNPAVVKLNQQLVSLKASVASSLGRLQSSLNIQKRDLIAKEGEYNRRISKMPGQERQYREIARQQKVKEELYLFLLQKREETAIALAATEANARVIDSAKASFAPVAPKKNVIYLIALLSGLLIPFGVIYVIDLLDTKIKSRSDVEGKTQIPFIGDVPRSLSPTEIIQTESRSSSAEALRIIRTNLEFMLGKVPDGFAKTIFMTSTFPKEGKTFVSVNLAATFALTGKKVLLIGMDIRNPRLDEYLSLPQRGVTNYLSSKDVSLQELVVKQDDFDDFYVLPAGVIPPNPAELLMSKKVDVLFEALKKEFDYIVVDTAPVSLVTDTMLIAKHADCVVYVARANYLEKRMLNVPAILYKEGKLPNMCMLLNDTVTEKGYGYYGYGYGNYGYGYGYGADPIKKEPWYKTILEASKN